MAKQPQNIGKRLARKLVRLRKTRLHYDDAAFCYIVCRRNIKGEVYTRQVLNVTQSRNCFAMLVISTCCTMMKFHSVMFNSLVAQTTFFLGTGKRVSSEHAVWIGKH